jgi:MFS family permease
VVEPSLFTHRGFVAGLVFLGTFFVAMSGMMLVINLFLQLGLGFTPMHTGLAMTPLALGIAVGAAASGAALGPRFGRHVLHAGLGLVLVGLGWFALSVGDPVSAPTAWSLAPSLFVSGLGSGMVFAPLFDIILADLGDHEVGTGSGLLNAVQQFSGALGVAVLGTVFLHWLPLDGWFDATKNLALLAAGCYVVSFLAVFLLPLRARDDAAVA